MTRLRGLNISFAHACSITLTLAVVDGDYVGEGVADLDDKARERTHGVELCHEVVQDAEGGDIELLKEDLACALIGIVGEAQEAGDE